MTTRLEPLDHPAIAYRFRLLTAAGFEEIKGACAPCMLSGCQAGGDRSAGGVQAD
ncbi:MAG: hypothetical protein ABSH36_04275 [Solirubrobacteraceae bacterium]